MMKQLHKKAVRLGYNLSYKRKKIYKIFTHLEKTQYYSVERLNGLQLKKLKKLLIHAYENTKYYKELFDRAGFNPYGFQSVSELRKIPLLTKENIKQHQDDMISSVLPKGKLKQNHTGGSTGVPLSFYQCKNYWEHARADLLRTYIMCGYQPGDRVLYFWGSDKEAKLHNGLLTHLKERLFLNVLWINTFSLPQDSLFDYIRRIELFQPEYVIGYASSLALLARAIKKKGVVRVRPKSIQSSAEVLTEEKRALIEGVFGCKVFDRYGSRELGNIAHECSFHNGFHVLSENNLVEIIKPDGTPALPNEEGELIVTNLNNYGMPFIRYRVGDIAVSSDKSCPCGRGLPLIKEIRGRVCDTIRSPNGTLLHGEYFTHLFYKIGGVRQFQVIQETLNDLVVTIVPDKDFNEPESLGFLRKKICGLDKDFRIKFQMYENIPVSPSGKFRFTVSKLNYE